MQRVPNYGSYLQSLGLLQMLHELGHSAILVDYRPEAPAVPHSSIYHKLWRIRKVPAVDWLTDELSRAMHGDGFALRYKREFLPALGVGYRHNYREAVDAAIIGSDEVFNCLQKGFNVGFSPMLFGEGVNAGKVISYAASFGSTTIDALHYYGVAEKVATWLANLSSISVRDENSKRIVDELLGSSVAEIHLDPVFVSDYAVPEKSLGIGSYAVLYTYKNRPYSAEQIEAIQRFCSSNGLRLVSFGDAKDWVDVAVDATPLEMLAYLDKASFVITDTFHGAVFSMRANRNFAVLVREDNRNKLEDVLVRLGQESRTIQTFNELQAMYEQPPLFNKTNEIIARERIRSRDYLRRALLNEAHTS